MNRKKHHESFEGVNLIKKQKKNIGLLQKNSPTFLSYILWCK